MDQILETSQTAVALVKAQGDEAKQQLHRLEHLHTQVMTTLPIGILVHQDREVRLTNPALFSLLQLDQTLDGKCLVETIEELFAQTTTPPHALQRKDRSLLMRRVNLDPDQLLYLIIDHSKEARLQEQMQSQRDFALMGEISAGLAHELKNALSVFQGNLQLMQKRGLQENHALFPYWQGLHHESARIQSLLHGFMQGAKAYVFHRKTFRFDHWIRLRLEELQQQWPHLNLVIHENTHETNPMVENDPEALRSIFHNLCLNAVEAQHQQENPELTLRFFQTEHSFGFSLADAGPGVSEAMVHKLFSPFVSQKKGGFGLGLFHSRMLAIRLGGTLTFSQPPTCFHLHMPLIDQGDEETPNG